MIFRAGQGMDEVSAPALPVTGRLGEISHILHTVYIYLYICVLVMTFFPFV